MPDVIPMIDPKRQYTASQAARFFKVHSAQLYRWADPSDSAKSYSPIKGKLQLVSRHPFRVSGQAILDFMALRKSLERPHSGVIANPTSGNMKLGRAAATTVARQSCPESCPFKEKGCYAEHDNTRSHWDRITLGSAGQSPLELARAEADAIDGLPGDRDLRLHVAGDSTTEEGTRLIAAACGRYIARGKALDLDVKAWAYTHAWRFLPSELWAPISVLASCETPADVKLAHERGYAAALVVPEFDGDKAYAHSGVTILPCPQQTRKRTCTDCRLCFAAERLHARKLVIGFALHGWGINKAREVLRRVSLPVVNEPTRKAA